MPQLPSSDAAEFDRLLRDHVTVLYRYAYRWTGSVERSEDLVQELLTRLFPQLPQLRRIERLRPWAVRVMYRIFIDELRRDRRSPIRYVGASGVAGSGGDDENLEVADDAEAPPELVDRAILQEQIVAAWAGLLAEHRVVLSMHDIEGYSLEEVAEIVGVPLGTAKSRLHRARARLRQLLAEGTNSAARTCRLVGDIER
jgi:RNA polymerase sigma factor (sigma-70 family)